jgi:hypothetical protein
MKKTNSEILHFFFADATVLDTEKVLADVVASPLMMDVSLERLPTDMTILDDIYPMNDGDSFLVRLPDNTYYWLDTASYSTDTTNGKAYYTLSPVDVPIEYQEIFLEWFTEVLRELMYS